MVRYKYDNMIIEVTVVPDLTNDQKLLMKAIQDGNIDELHKLFKQGISPNFIDHNGYSPLHLAVMVPLIQNLLVSC